MCSLFLLLLSLSVAGTNSKLTKMWFYVEKKVDLQVDYIASTSCSTEFISAKSSIFADVFLAS